MSKLDDANGERTTTGNLLRQIYGKREGLLRPEDDSVVAVDARGVTNSVWMGWRSVVEELGSNI